MEQNPLLELEVLGQSIWIDFLRRETTLSGELKRMIEEDGVSGVTSNPSIFEKAIAESHDYDETIQKLTAEGRSYIEVPGRVDPSPADQYSLFHKRTAFAAPPAIS